MNFTGSTRGFAEILDCALEDGERGSEKISDRLRTGGSRYDRGAEQRRRQVALDTLGFIAENIPMGEKK